MIELRNVCAGYGEKQVLHGVNMKFEPGKITVLIGPNGCGKSTLLKTIVRIVEHTSGEITVRERAVNGGPESSRRVWTGTSPDISKYEWRETGIEKLSAAERAKRVAYLPQSKKAPDISAFRMVLHGRFAYLSYPRKYRAEDMRIAREALAWAGLEENAEEMVSRLSGGVQQKVYIAMALAQDADTILMDEPTTYLDVAHQLRLMSLAQKLADEGKAVVMVLHDLSQALRIADEVVLLKDGKVLQSGTAEQVYEGGMLQKAFGVEIERVKTKTGWHYLCDAGVCEEFEER